MLNRVSADESSLEQPAEVGHSGSLSESGGDLGLSITGKAGRKRTKHWRRYTVMADNQQLPLGRFPGIFDPSTGGVLATGYQT
jgi:hypothetical protein